MQRVGPCQTMRRDTEKGNMVCIAVAEPLVQSIYYYERRMSLGNVGSKGLTGIECM